MDETDRELLELAARAAVIEHGPDRTECGLSLTEPDGRHRHLPRWNPLDDDGDALRLAVKLDIVPRVINRVAFAWKDGVCDAHEAHNGDPYAATRRAIVRAAAAIAQQGNGGTS